jgi:transposase
LGVVGLAVDLRLPREVIRHTRPIRAFRNVWMKIGLKNHVCLRRHEHKTRWAGLILRHMEAVMMHFVAIKTPEQMDLLALHRARSRLVSQRTGVSNQIRGFLIERGITVRQGVVPLRKALLDILSSNTGALSPRMVNLIAELVQDWRRLDERIAAVSAEIESLAEQDEGGEFLEGI